MVIIGADYHPGFQQIAYVDTETGELQERRLGHRKEAEKFYRDLGSRGAQVRVGMEASGHARWFERLLAELNFELWIGNAAKIRAKRVRKQKTARSRSGLTGSQHPRLSLRGAYVPAKSHESFVLRLGFLQEHHIRIGVAAQDAKLLAIRRPVKREDLLGVEVCNLMARTTVDGLNPDVIHTILFDWVGDRLSVCSELHTFGNSRIGVEHAWRTKRRDIQQGD